ncbi:MAG TPA: hypothetical protein VEJ38_14785 [Candidatus Acidoferrales bacterium]|nr:hypothetical protein [Candidatus Acidoferrales bacterium]
MKMRTAGAAKKAIASSLILASISLSALALASIAAADTLELKTGEIIQGKFIGGSSMNIRFRVNGQEQVFATKDVLNIGFSDSGDASNAVPPPQAAAVPQPPPPSVLPDAPRPQVAPAAPVVPPQPNPPAAVAAAPASQGQYITIPAGTSVFVRMIDSVDSSVNEVGDTFKASLESPLLVGNTVVAPKGADAYGRLTQAKEAGKISGGAELTLELTGIRVGGNIVPLNSTDYDVAGKGRGTQSAQRIGGGAVIGTIIGAIAGGGKGAAIGAVAGAGTGTAVQVFTHGDKVRVPSETLLEFRLQNDVSAPLPGPAN